MGCLLDLVICSSAAELYVLIEVKLTKIPVVLLVLPGQSSPEARVGKPRGCVVSKSLSRSAVKNQQQ